MQAWQNLGLGITSIVAGKIAEKGWIQIETFFACMVFCKYSYQVKFLISNILF